jgi:hypothetical protein
VPSAARASCAAPVAQLPRLPRSARLIEPAAVRPAVRARPRRLAPITFVNESGAGAGGFTDPASPGKGLCEVCHRKTDVCRRMLSPFSFASATASGVSRPMWTHTFRIPASPAWRTASRVPRARRRPPRHYPAGGRARGDVAQRGRRSRGATAPRGRAARPKRQPASRRWPVLRCRSRAVLYIHAARAVPLGAGGPPPPTNPGRSWPVSRAAGPHRCGASGERVTAVDVERRTGHVARRVDARNTAAPSGDPGPSVGAMTRGKG